MNAHPPIQFMNIRKPLLFLFILVLAGPIPVLGKQNTRLGQPETGTTENTNAPIEDQEDLPDTKKSKKKKQKDPNRGRILPIPVFITEPAVGDGLGLVIAYFHRKKDQPEGTTVASPNSIGELSKEQAPPPTVTGIFGAYTSNETRAGGIGHMNSFKDDHIRFTGLAAYADLNSTFYLLDQPFKFNLNGFLAYQETRVRFRDSKWFWGIGLSYLDANTSFKLELPEEAPIDLFGVDLKNVGLSGKLAWDSRDNTSMPNTGQLIDLSLWRYDEALGGDYDFWNAKLKLLSFHQLHEKFVLGVRFEYSAIDGRAPFFAIPWVSLRGIAAMRYQGDRVGVAELEGRYNFTAKWAMVGFTGFGKVSSDIPVFDTQQDIYSYGLGARYKIFDAQNIWVGIDIARVPEDYNWYIQVGQAW
jgi:hypothetical protein